MISRRDFVKSAAVVAASSVLPTGDLFGTEPRPMPFRISLAQWSLHRSFQKRAGTAPLELLDFARIARGLDIDGVEYVSLFFKDRGGDRSYISEMKARAASEGVRSLLIMVDGEGDVGAADPGQRSATVASHLRWLDAAAFLGCHSVRVNAASNPRLPADEQARLAADGLHRLALEADQRELWLVVENHGGLSSNGKWLTKVMQMADHPRVGILPDFGNFYTDRKAGELYNPYQGLREFMPWVKEAVSAKCWDWDTGAGRFYTEDRRAGMEMTLDYDRLIRIVLTAGYHGYVGIEYEGEKHSEIEGIKRAKQALEELRTRVMQEKP